jgi:transcriptional regulator with XRE-family HTH domain
VPTPPNPLEKQLAKFLKERRGDMTFAAFARKVGLPPSTLHRIEHGQQSASLKIVHQLATRLKVSWLDIFS